MVSTSFSPAIEEERAAEADETILLKQSMQFLQAALQQLVNTENEFPKGRKASSQEFQSIAYQMAGHFAQAGIEIASAITKLKNSLFDEGRLRDVAYAVYNRARTAGDVRITSLESKTINLAKRHGNTITDIISKLETIKNYLEKIKDIFPNDFGNKYFNLDNIRKVSINELGTVINQINGYVKGLNRLFKIFNMAEGKKPFWKLW